MWGQGETLSPKGAALQRKIREADRLEDAPHSDHEFHLEPKHLRVYSTDESTPVGPLRTRSIRQSPPQKARRYCPAKVRRELSVFKVDLLNAKYSTDRSLPHKIRGYVL